MLEPHACVQQYTLYAFAFSVSAEKSINACGLCAQRGTGDGVLLDPFSAQLGNVLYSGYDKPIVSAILTQK